MPSAPFGFGGLLGGGPVPDVQMPDGLPVGGGLGSPLVDAYLALQGKRIKDAVTAPRDAYTGDLQVLGADGHPTDEAMDRASGLAGLAMTGSMPFKAPAGAIRSFGGAAAHDDPLAALSAALGDLKPNSNLAPSSFVDPAAKQWDLYHGTNAPTDFAKFRVDLPHVQGQTNSAPGEAGALFLSPAAAEAAHYAGDIAATGAKGYRGDAGPRVIRATVDPGKTDLIDIPQMVLNDPDFVARARKAYLSDNGRSFFNEDMFDRNIARIQDDVRGQMGVNQSARNNGYPEQPVEVPYAFGMAGAAVQLAKERGLDTAVLRGLSESNGGDQVVALTPGRVRSYYDPDHLLYSGGPVGGLAGAPALASSSDPKGSPVSAGLAPFGALSPADIARLMQQARPQMDVSPDEVPAAIPPGFTGFVPPTAPTMQPPVAAAPAVEPEAPARAPLRMFGALPPQISAPAAAEPERSPLPSLVGSRAPAVPVGATAAPRGDDEAPAATAAPRPLTFGSLPASAAPATTGSTTAPAAAPSSSPAAEPSLLDRIGDGLRNLNANGGGDLLTSLGIGLMSTPGFGRGAAAGLKSYQDNEGKRAASDLARAEYGLKAQKVQRELSGDNATVAALQRGGYSQQDALGLVQAAAAGHREGLQNALNNLYPKKEIPSGFTLDASGTAAPIPGGPQDLATIKAQAEARDTKDDSTADQKNYEAAKKGGYEGSFTDFLNFKGNASRAQTVVNNAINPILKGLGDQFVTSADNARAGADQIRAIQNARSQLDSAGGIISGFRAGDRLALQKVGSLLGVTNPDAIQNTESLRAALKPMVLAAVKGLGSNPSNGDRTFAEDFSGGNIALDEGSIRRILDLNERSARATISRHNALADQMLATQPDLKQVGPMMQVQAPDDQSAASQRAGARPTSDTPAMGPLDQARAAIKAGADPNKVKTRLLKFGIDPQGL